MKTDDFDFDLPEELIAQTPLLKRDTSKLLVLDKETGYIEHKSFTDIIDYLNEDDVLVFNDTKVLPARLYGIKTETNAAIELLLLKEINTDEWECLVKPARRVKKGTEIDFGGILKAICTEEKEDGIRNFKFEYEGIFLEKLDLLGEMPLPPYIKEKLQDKDRYQTVYATNVGSSAAPTAGLHFTNEIFEKLEEKNIECVFVTLHVGLGTFRPVSVDDVSSHNMHTESYHMSLEAANTLNNAKRDGKSIVSVGTTSTRVLETIYNEYNEFRECSGETSIFIYPGYEFLAVDKLITNFHLPKSTLMMLVSALSSKEIILNAYNEAVKNQYRFFSFGDSMFIK